MIKKMRFKVEPASYGEMGHLEFFHNGTALKVDLSEKTLTLKSGEVVNITARASSEHGAGWEAIQCFNASDDSHSYACWCSATGGGEECWLELEFTPALPKSFANKMTFCCGQNHGSYPATFTLFFIDENGGSEQIGEPLYVDAHNGVFEWASKIRCIRGKDGKYYFLRPSSSEALAGSPA